MLKNEKVVDTIIDEEKSYFFPRFAAYAIDFVIVILISSLIVGFVPQNKNLEKYQKESEQILKDYQKGNIDTKDYFNKMAPVSYDMDYANLPSTFISLTISILYFIVFQYYNKGQTFGKKLMKIKVMSTDGNLSINQMAIRALFINLILFNVLVIGAVLFAGKTYYFNTNLIIEVVAFIFVVISSVFAMYRKDGRGLHDMMANTKVIKEN